MTTLQRNDIGIGLPQTHPSLSRMLVTPEWAESMLRNIPKGQRPIRRYHVETIARDINNGKWDADICNPIRISASGQLIDGQHRLTAIVSAGIPVWMWVERRDSFLHIDECRTRSQGDVLSMGGVTNASKTASIIRATTYARQAMAENSDYGNCMKRSGMTPADVLQVATHDHRLASVVEDAAKVHGLMPSAGRVFTVANIGAFLLLSLDTHGNCDGQLSWLRTTASDVGHEVGSPSLAYRRWSLRATGIERREHELPNIIKCWNAHARGKTMVQAAGFRYCKIDPILPAPTAQ